ncbi:hypothetical protein ACFUC0_24395, partial [Bacillus subtilis]
LPVGTPSDRFTPYATTLAEAARLPAGCLVRIEHAGKQGHLIIDVDTHDMSTVTTDYPMHDATVPLTVNGPLPWALDRAGDPIHVHLREACALIVGPPGSAKTTLLDGIIGTFNRCTDVLVWGIDVGKSGDAFVPWVLPWLEATGAAAPPASTPRAPEGTSPGVDWVAPTLAEAELMLDALISIGKRRLSAYRDMMRAQDTKLLPVSSELPMIFCVIDEGAEMLAYQGQDPLRNRVKTKVLEVMRTLRAMGIRLILTATDGNLSSLGDSAVRKYSPVRVALTTTDPEGAGIAKLFGRVKGLDARQLRAKGSGVIGASTGDDYAFTPTAMRTFLTAPSMAREMTIRTVPIRPVGLDKPSADAAGDSYLNRWDPKRISWLIVPESGGDSDPDAPGANQPPAVTRTTRTNFRRTLNLPAKQDAPEEQQEEKAEPRNPAELGPVTDADLASFLGILEKLPTVDEPQRQEQRETAPERDRTAGPAWLPEAVEAIREQGQEGMKVGALAELLGLNRKTVREALRVCPELVYRSNGPHSVYVHRDHDA